MCFVHLVFLPIWFRYLYFIFKITRIGNSLVARISACQVLSGTARGGPGFNSPLPSIFLFQSVFMFFLIFTTDYEMDSYTMKCLLLSFILISFNFCLCIVFLPFFYTLIFQVLVKQISYLQNHKHYTGNYQ